MTEQQDAVDAFLAHYGVKGMRWGVRKERDASGETTSNRVFNKRNAAIAGGVVAIGAGVTLAILAKNGTIATSAIKSNPQVREAMKGGAKFIANQAKSGGAKAASSSASSSSAAKAKATADSIRKTQQMFEKIQWDAKVKDFDKLIADAHAEQTLAMRKAMAAYGGTYNPRDNQFTPEAKRLQIGR